MVLDGLQLFMSFLLRASKRVIQKKCLPLFFADFYLAVFQIKSVLKKKTEIRNQKSEIRTYLIWMTSTWFKERRYSSKEFNLFIATC